MFRAGHTIQLPEEFLQKYGLDIEHSFAKFEHLKTLLNFQKNTLFKLSPRLKEDCLDPSHFKVIFLL